MLNIKNYNRREAIKLPFENLSIITGNDYLKKQLILNSLMKCFSRSKISQKEEEYLEGEEVELFINSSKVNKKEYVPLVIKAENNIESEMQLSKTSYMRKIFEQVLDVIFEYDPQIQFINDLIQEVIDSNYCSQLKELERIINGNLENCNLSINTKTLQLNKKVFIESFLEMNILKDEVSIPIEYTSNYEKLLMFLCVIEYLIKFINIDSKILIIVDHIEYKLDDDEIKSVYNKILELSNISKVDTIILCDDLRYIDITQNNIELVTILNKGKEIRIKDYEALLKDVELEYPKFIEREKLSQIILSCLKKYTKYLVDNIIVGTELNVKNLMQVVSLEELTIMKILGGVFNLKNFNICMKSDESVTVEGRFLAS